MRGTTAKRRSGTRWTPAGCDEWWRRSPTRPAGHGSCPSATSGIAAHYSFLSYIAAVAEVAVDEEGELTIPRVDMQWIVGAP